MGDGSSQPHAPVPGEGVGVPGRGRRDGGPRKAGDSRSSWMMAPRGGSPRYRHPDVAGAVPGPGRPCRLAARWRLVASRNTGHSHRTFSESIRMMVRFMIVVLPGTVVTPRRRGRLDFGQVITNEPVSGHSWRFFQASLPLQQRETVLWGEGMEINGGNVWPGAGSPPLARGVGDQLRATLVPCPAGGLTTARNLVRRPQIPTRGGRAVAGLRVLLA
jgi:hypothetical protein